MGVRYGRRGSSGCGGCLCFAFILMLFATVSPYWIWRSAWVSYSTTSTVATGSYVASSSSSQIYSWPYKYYISSQWNHFDVFINDSNNTLCNNTAFLDGNSNYNLIGKYGWCRQGPNGKVNIPSKISEIQGLTTACTVVLFAASILALIAPNSGGSKMGFAATGLSFVAMCLSCAAFSVAVSFDWYQSFGQRGFLPFYNNANNVVMLSQGLVMYWGPAFWSSVTVFIITVIATASMCVVSKSLDDEIDGIHGGGDSEDPNADLDQTNDYAHGVNKA